MAEGTLLELWRWPVKSMAGEAVRSSRFDGRGMGGDRTHALWHLHKGTMTHLTAREAPRLLAWKASYPFARDAALRPERPPPATVVAPGGRSYVWGDPRLRFALQDDLGRAVELRSDPAGQQDRGYCVLVTFEATLRAFEAELGRPLDLRRFRTNLHQELDAPAWAELGWHGRRLELAGGVVLRIDDPCERCVIPTRDPDTQEKWAELMVRLERDHGQRFGVNATVVGAGRAEVGEHVRLMP